MPILRCLFCNHVNPVEASFCNACGSQLDLQPCGQCGAVDSRTAKYCHKCATPFMPHAAAESDALLESVPQGDHGDYSSRIEAGVAGAKAMVHAHDQPRSSNYSLLTVNAAAPDSLAQPDKSRSNWLIPGVGLLVMLIAAAFAIFYQQPPATVSAQTVAPVLPRVAEAPAETPPPTKPLSAEPAPALGLQAAAPEVTKPAQAKPIAPAVVAGEPVKTPARAAPRAVTRLAEPPLPVANTQPAARRAPAAVQNCSQAVATLGLCNP